MVEVRCRRMSKENDKGYADFRAWFSTEWNRLRKLYGAADRKPSPPAQAPKPPEALEKTLAELDELAERARKLEKHVRVDPAALKLFARKLRKLMEDYRITQKSMAAAMGYRSVSTLCSWINGTTAPTPEAWKKARAAILELAEVGKC